MGADGNVGADADLAVATTTTWRRANKADKQSRNKQAYSLVWNGKLLVEFESLLEH